MGLDAGAAPERAAVWMDALDGICMWWIWSGGTRARWRPMVRMRGRRPHRRIQGWHGEPRFSACQLRDACLRVCPPLALACAPAASSKVLLSCGGRHGCFTSSPRHPNGPRCAVEPAAPRNTDGERTARSSRRQVVATGKQWPCREEVQVTDVTDAPVAAGRPANLNGRSAAQAGIGGPNTQWRDCAHCSPSLRRR